MKRGALLVLGGLLICMLLYGAAAAGRTEGDNVLSARVEIKKNSGTVYQMLRHVSDQTGYLFIYDSRLIDNDKKIKLDRGDYTVREAIYAITGSSDIDLIVDGKHILLKAARPVVTSVPTNTDPAENKEIVKLFFSGTVFDNVSGDPIAYATVGVENTSIGTATNMDGKFRLVFPDSLASEYVRITHLGYETRRLPLEYISGQEIDIPLEPQIMTLQEVVVSTVDPLSIIERMLESCKYNYPEHDMLLLPFYRERMEYGRKSTELTEGVLQVYKTPWFSDSPERVKLLKMRRIASNGYEDILPKLRSGIEACIMLDIVKRLPDFLIFPEAREYYNYIHSDITFIDGRRVNVISFSPKKKVYHQLFTGELFIDAENYALIGASFGVDPQHMAEASPNFIVRKNRAVRLSLENAWYNVSYNIAENGRYYLNQMKCELAFRYKKKKALFSSNLNVTIDMVVCGIEEENVGRIPRQEALIPRIIFSDVKHPYDERFWENFNVILPEKKLKELIMNNLSEVLDEQ